MDSSDILEFDKALENVLVAIKGNSPTLEKAIADLQVTLQGASSIPKKQMHKMVPSLKILSDAITDFQLTLDRPYPDFETLRRALENVMRKIVSLVAK